MNKSFHTHDHDYCIANGIKAAVEICKATNLRLTPIRRRVLEILLSEHRAMGAYEVLSILQSEDFANKPPTVYRALDFLVANGFAHKIECLNAFVSCNNMGLNHSPTFLICRSCGHVAESQTTSPVATLDSVAHRTGFTIESTTLEAKGLCPACVMAKPCT